jgi:Glycosyl transferase family 11
VNTIGSFGQHIGQLGNQLFQVALLFAIKQRRGHDFYLAHNGESLWDCIDLDIPATGPECAHRFDERFGSCNFDPGVFEQPDGTAYHGFFQSYRYLEDCKDSLTRYLRFHEHHRALAEACLFALRRQHQRPLVSVHVRRGDYVTNSHLFGDLPADGYYERVVEAIGSDVTYLVFSDDLPWCRRSLDLGTTVFVDLDHFSTLYLMTRCDVNVVANSSFSWWGAFLNPMSEVYAPSRWFGPAWLPPNDRQDDIVLPTWSTVPVWADWDGERSVNGSERP